MLCANSDVMLNVATLIMTYCLYFGSGNGKTQGSQISDATQIHLPHKQEIIV